MGCPSLKPAEAPNVPTSAVGPVDDFIDGEIVGSLEQFGSGCAATGRSNIEAVLVLPLVDSEVLSYGNVMTTIQ